MKSNKTWIDLAAPVIGVVLLGGAAFLWINGVEGSQWIKASKANTIVGAFTVIAAITAFNCGLLIAVAALATRLRNRS